jgi:hypothetical protein
VEFHQHKISFRKKIKFQRTSLHRLRESNHDKLYTKPVPLKKLKSHQREKLLISHCLQEIKQYILHQEFITNEITTLQSYAPQAFKSHKDSRYIEIKNISYNFYKFKHHVTPELVAEL